MTDNQQLPTPQNPIEILRGLQTPERRARNAIIEGLKARYIKTDRDDVLLARVEELFDNIVRRSDPKSAAGDENRVEARAIAVVGDSGVGKSKALQRVFTTHPAFSQIPWISVTVPSPCVLAQLGRVFLQTAGFPLLRELSAPLVWERVRGRISDERFVVVHFEEMQRVTQDKNDKDLAKIKDACVDLMQDKWPTGLIFSGTSKLYEFLAFDFQFQRRVWTVPFEKLSPSADSDMLLDITSEYATAAGLQFITRPEEALAPRLCHTALEALGYSIEIIIDTINGVLTEGGKALTIRDFARSYSGHTGCAADKNPFLVRDWTTIDITHLHLEKKPDVPGETSGGPKGKKR